jgi:hypothetical protein
MIINKMVDLTCHGQCQEPTIRDQANSHGKGEDLGGNPENNYIMGGAA